MKNHLSHHFFFLCIGITLFILIVITFSLSVRKNEAKITIPDASSEQNRAFFLAAKKQIDVVTSYDFWNGYYGDGGFPPENTGVCSDVIWRAFGETGQDFKAQIEQDIQKNPSAYTSADDTNINFRRVKNIDIFLKHRAQTLENIIIPWNIENLIQWQTGDIVIFDELPENHLWHIGIISDIRRGDGVPYMLDNHGKWVWMTMTPLDWPTNVIGHYRYF